MAQTRIPEKRLAGFARWNRYTQHRAFDEFWGYGEAGMDLSHWHGSWRSGGKGRESMAQHRQWASAHGEERIFGKCFKEASGI